MTLRAFFKRVLPAVAVAAALAPTLSSAQNFTVRLPMVTVAFTPSTQTFDFGTVPVGARPVRTFLFANKSSSTLTLGSVSTAGSAQLEKNGCPATLAPGASCNVTVALPVTATGQVGGDVRILTNGATAPEVLRVSANGAPEESFITATPGSLAFGEQAVGTTSSVQTLTLRNTSASDVYLGDLYFAENSAYFGKSSTCDMYLPAGGSCAVAVRFMPRLMGATQARLVRDLEDGTQLYVASVSGTGVRAEATWSLTSANFLDVPVGVRTQPQTIGLTNTGRGSLTIKSLAIIGDSAFRLDSHTCGTTVASMASCEVKVSALVPDPLTHTATLKLESDSLESRSSLVQLYARPANLVASLTVSPASLDFANVPVGATSSAQRVTLESTGSQAVAVTGYTLTGPNASEFAFVTPNACLGTLAPDQQCSFDVVAKPGSVGTRTAAISFVSSSSLSVLDVALRTVGTRGTLVAAPTRVDFGDVNVGRSGSASVVLSNTGSAPVQVSSTALSGAQANLFTVNGCVGQTIAAGANCTLTIGFTPSVAGSAAASLAIANTGTTPSVAVALAGRGLVVAPTASLTEFTCPTIVPFGAAASCTATLSNTGTVALPVSAVTSSLASFPVTHNCGTSLTTGTSCTLTATITPNPVPASGTSTFSTTVTVPTGAQTFTRTVALTAEVSRLTFSAGAYAPVAAGTSANATHVLTNSGKFPVALNTAPVLGALSSSGAFVLRSTTCTGTLAAGASCNVVVGCVAPATAQTLTATLSAVGSNSAQAQAALSCQSFVPVSAGNLSSTPNPLSFGAVAVGQSATQTLTLSNRNTTAVRLDTFTFTGTGAADFAVVSNTCATLPALSGTMPGTCSVQVRFSPRSAVLSSATLRAASSTQALSVDTAVSGTGALAALSVTPNPATFVDTTVGQANTLALTMRNAGPVAVTLPAAASWSLVGDATELSFSANACAGATLAVNGTCSITARFAPTSAGTKRATLALSPAGASALSLSLGGNALPAPVARPVLGPLSCTGTAAAGGTLPCSVTLTNSGTAALGLPSQPLVGVNVDPRTVTLPLPLGAFQAPRCGASLSSLAVGASCTYTFQTTALREGANTVGFALNTSAGNVYAAGSATTVAASGVLTTTEHQSAPGATTYATHSLTNTGAVPITFASSTATMQAAMTGAPEITFSGKPPFGIACGASLAPGARCELMTACTPRAAGTFTGTLTVRTLNNSPVISAPVRCVATPPSFRVEPAAALTSEAGGWSGSGNYMKVTNTGSSPLSFQWVAPTGTNWVMSSTASNASHCTSGKQLAAGASCQVLFSLANDVPGASYTLAHRIRMLSGTTALEQPVSMTLAVRGLTMQNTLAFGPAQVGTSQEAVYRFTNVAPHPMTAAGAQLSGSPAVTLVSQNCTGTLAPGASCEARVRALPTLAGNVSSTLVVRGSYPRYLNTVQSGAGVSNVQSSVPIVLTASTPKLTLTPGAFTAVLAGQTSDATVSVRNDGAAPVQLTRFVATPASSGTLGGFAVTGGTCSTSAPLAAGASCTVQVRFAPTTYNGALTAGSLSVEAGTLKVPAALSGLRKMAGSVLLSVTDNLTEVAAGGRTTYQVAVTNRVQATAPVTLNLATSATGGATVMASPPMCPTFLSGGSSCLVQGNVVQLRVAANATLTVTQSAQAGTTPGTAVMDASIIVDPSVEDTSTADNVARDTTAVVLPKADIAVTATTLPSLEYANSTGAVTVTVRNATSTYSALNAKSAVPIRLTNAFTAQGTASARVSTVSCQTVTTGGTCSASGAAATLSLPPNGTATLQVGYATEAGTGTLQLTSEAQLMANSGASEMSDANNRASSSTQLSTLRRWLPGSSTGLCNGWGYGMVTPESVQCNYFGISAWRNGINTTATAYKRSDYYMLNPQLYSGTGWAFVGDSRNNPDVNVGWGYRDSYPVSRKWDDEELRGSGPVYIGPDGAKYYFTYFSNHVTPQYSSGNFNVFYRRSALIVLNANGTLRYSRSYGAADYSRVPQPFDWMGHGFDPARDTIFIPAFTTNGADGTWQTLTLYQVKMSTGAVVASWPHYRFGAAFAYDKATGDMYFADGTTNLGSTAMGSSTSMTRFNPYSGATSKVTLPQAVNFAYTGQRMHAYNGVIYVITLQNLTAQGGAQLVRIDARQPVASVEVLASSTSGIGGSSNKLDMALGGPGDLTLYVPFFNAKIPLQ